MRERKRGITDHSDSLARKCAGWIVKDLEATKEEGRPAEE